MEIELKPCFAEPVLNVMNFLNEVVLRYPEAISFAPGRPAESFFDVEASLEEIDRFVDYRCQRLGWTRERVLGDLGQYNKTNGIINELIARHLELDEGIDIAPEAVVLTCGCQEGMNVLLAALFEPGRDVLLSSDPTYIGITGLADILGIEVVPVRAGENGIEVEAVAEAIERVRRSGKRPRAFYDVPDFNNPMGTSMPLPVRRDLLALARDEGILLFEDNPYGMFAYDGEPQPTLKSLDEHGVVIYMGTFSKTLFPGLRVGYLVADQQATVEGAEGGANLLAAELSKVKSLTSVTTSPLLQAMVGGTLLRTGGSLRPAMTDKITHYRRNRDAMLNALEEHFGSVEGVRWNRPAGGFFLTVYLPFVFDEGALRRCAEEFGVIVCPMADFARVDGCEQMIRLSFSYVTPDQIEQGIERLAQFVLDTLRA